MSAALVESVREAVTAAQSATVHYGYREAALALESLDLPAILAALTEGEALRAQVAAGQAREVALREALAHYDGRAYHSEYESDGQIQWVAESALRSIAEPDTAALRKMLRHVATVAGREGMETTEALDELVDRVLGGS